MHRSNASMRLPFEIGAQPQPSINRSTLTRRRAIGSGIGQAVCNAGCVTMQWLPMVCCSVASKKRYAPRNSVQDVRSFRCQIIRVTMSVSDSRDCKHLHLVLVAQPDVPPSLVGAGCVGLLCLGA